MICGGAQLYKYCFDKNYIDNFLITYISTPGLVQMSQDKNNIFFPKNILQTLEQDWQKSEFFYSENPDFPIEQSNDISVRFFNYQKIR